MNDNDGKAKERDIQKRAFSFACRIVKLYQFLAKQKGVGEVKRIDQRIGRTGRIPYDYREKLSSFRGNLNMYNSKFYVLNSKFF